MNPLKTALDCQRSVFIQACAGAGKTFALTKRYANILDSFSQECLNGKKTGLLGPKNILVITFTKKAAGEMKERILRDVNILLSGHELKDMKDQGFDFCPNLRKTDNEALDKYKKDLQENFSQNAISTIDSFCAGVLREFAYKLGIDPQFLSQDDHDTKKLLNENLEIWIAQKLKDAPDSFDILLEDLAFYQIKDILKGMIASREILDEYLEDFETKNEDQIWQDWLRRYTSDVDTMTMEVRLRSLWNEAQDKCKDKGDNLYQLLEKLVNRTEQLKVYIDPNEYKSAFISEVLNRKGDLLTLKNGKLVYKVSMPGTAKNWNDNFKKDAQEWFDHVKDTIIIDDVLGTPSPQDKKIIPILKDIIAKFREFDDFFRNIRLDRDLLDFSDVIILTHKLLSEHADVRSILAKRYQHILLDEFQDTNPLRWQIIEMIVNENPNIKLFVVGDRKQSIYRFNNADVTVMDTAEKMVVEKLKGLKVEFNDNYRSSEQFINEAVNPLMSMILKSVGEDKEAYEADFAATVSPINKQGISPALETIWCQTGKDEEEYIPAHHCAYQVERLLKKHKNSEIDPGDDKPLVAVLLRRYTKLSDYIQAFGKRGIPVSILGGKDFYKSPALKDIFHLISVLDNPWDDLALIGLLRSPFFSLPDPIIHKLAGRKHNVFDAMGTISELQSAYREILTWREQSQTLALDTLIAKILDDKDRELGYVSELLPEQQLANLDKTINIIRGLQRSGSTLREIREFLHYQIFTDADEAQAAYPAKARVHILTVHKAKGLEYPIVLIPEMNQKGRGETNTLRYGRYEGNHEISLSLGDDEKPGLLMRLKDIIKKEEEAEDKRLFYVAVTRAIYKAVLLGEGEKATRNTWWAKYVLGVEQADKVDETLMETDSWDENITQVRKEQVLNILNVDTPGNLDWKEKEQFEEPGKYLYRSPHDLMGQKEDFDFFKIKGGLGTVPGKIFHYCMEQLWLDGKVNAQEITQYIKSEYPEFPHKDLLAKVQPWLDNIMASELSNVILDPTIEKYPELKIKGWLGNDKDIVQINGVIDLLYKKGNEWVILDYKTDADSKRLRDYKKQLQTYQWMVKQAYSIEAKAKIYFVAKNELVDVAWDDNYFDNLSLGLELSAQLPPAKAILGKIQNEIKDGPQLMLCASGQHEEQVYLGLVKTGLMRPDIKVSTLNKFLHEDAENGMSQDHLRLMIRHENPGMKDGTADHLAKALRNEELAKGSIKQEFRKLYHDITQQSDYRPADLVYRQASAKGQRIMLLDIHAQTEIEEALIARLKNEADLVEISLIEEKEAEQNILIEAFSPREEVMACAQHINEHCAPDEQVMIAVASMEKYAPHLQRQLPQFGLQARFIGDRSMFELPCTTLLMNYLELFRKPLPEWADLASVLLHPLMKPGLSLWLYDQKTRREPLNEPALPYEAVELCEKGKAKDFDELIEKVGKFIKEIKDSNDPDQSKACDKFMELLETVLADVRRVNSKAGINDLIHEMNLRIKKIGLPRRDQWNGIPVVGLLDSLGTRVDKLYILGMVEGDIPRQEGENPFFIQNKNYTLELNRYFMKEWKKLGDSVIFCTSTHAEDGSEQARSSFLEGMNLQTITLAPMGRRTQLLAYARKHIAGQQAEMIARHHEILEKRKAEFSGDIAKIEHAFDISVTQVDTLLKCPMRFYFETVLKCKELDQDEKLYWGSKKGNVIHNSYEAFIKAKGYELDEDAALELMRKCLDDALDKEGIDKDDPQQMDRFRYYIKDLHTGSDNNCLAKNLKTIREKYSTYTQFEYEKDFKNIKLEHPDLDIALRGRIDKIMLSNEDKQLIASDFKTGTIKPALLSKWMLSQLYLYLKYCAQEYPDYELKAMYELLKAPKDTKMLEYTLSETEFRQGRQSFIIQEFEEHLSALFSQIGAGKYYITEKPFKDACEYCGYEGLCRKNTRLKV